MADLPPEGSKKERWAISCRSVYLDSSIWHRLRDILRKSPDLASSSQDLALSFRDLASSSRDLASSSKFGVDRRIVI